MDSLEGLDFRKPNLSRLLETEPDEKKQKFRILEQKSWRFTYEALTHVHSLRLFLFNSGIPVPWRCASLQATLASESPVSSSPVVLCQWVGPDGGSHKLFVPMPVCLIDYSVPFAAFACSDHIEIKVQLLSSGGSFVEDLALLGFNYRGELVDRDGGEGRESTFSLNSDTELLTSKEEITFYCRNCSVKLTHQPISCFRSLPSTEWRELADHWFGVCCCRDGVHTKSLMARFDELMMPTSGVCLVGSTICIIHRNDLASRMVDHNQRVGVHGEADCMGMTENDGEIRTGDGLDAAMSREENRGNVPFGTDPALGGHELRPVNSPAITTNGCSPGANHGNGDCDSDKIPEYGAVAVDDCSHNAVEAPVEPHSCCNGSVAGHGNGASDKLPALDHAVKAKTLANGFMNGFPSSQLAPFYCYNCASLIGVCTGGTEGLQLFKCHISTDVSTLGGPSNVFRFHTLERVFGYELFSNAEEDSSYRFVVRDLNSRLSLLQLVIVNHESWNCSGFCAEEQRLIHEPQRTGSIGGDEVSISTGEEDDAYCTTSSLNSDLTTRPGNQKFSPVFLAPVMKVMFCDTSSFSSEQLGEVERWGQKNQSDDVYMLDSEVKSLTKSLQANQKLFPESAAAFQQFHLSFLAR